MGIEPTKPSQLLYDALPVELPGPWKHGGGEIGICIQLFLVESAKERGQAKIPRQPIKQRRSNKRL